MTMLSPLNRGNVWPRRSLSSGLMDDFFSDFDRMVDSLMTPTTTTSVNFTPTCDIRETKEHYLVSFDMPGVKKNDIKVEVNENQLMISGERNQEYKANEEEGFLRHERMYGHFQRTFVLPGTIDSEKIEAHYEDGVLNIALPKTEKAKGRAIQIQSGKGKGLFSKLLGAKSDEEREVRDVKVS